MIWIATEALGVALLHYTRDVPRMPSARRQLEPSLVSDTLQTLYHQKVTTYLDVNSSVDCPELVQLGEISVVRVSGVAVLVVAPFVSDIPRSQPDHVRLLSVHKIFGWQPMRGLLWSTYLRFDQERVVSSSFHFY